MTTRLLTKSRFKIGFECPTKLYFNGKLEYGNNKVDNSFLASLAEGGFQVGELAKLYHKGGTEIDTLDSAEAVARTLRLLEADSVTLYEPAISVGNLLVRVDILVKHGSSVELIEVKAKSFDRREKDQFYNKTALKKGDKKLHSEWEPYLVDIAFQTYVAQNAFPNWKITSALMLADKTAIASVEGLNQLFFLNKDERGRTYVDIPPEAKQIDLGVPLLIKVGVDDEVKLIINNGVDGNPFESFVNLLAASYADDKMVAPAIGPQCKLCEFRIGNEKKQLGLKSGFDVCWKTAAGISNGDINRPMIFDIWNFRKTQKLIEEGHYFVDELSESDIGPRPREEEAGLSSSERQWLQVEKIQKKDHTPYFDSKGMVDEMDGWQYPLHFIDFETTMVAIPFNMGRAPYEQIAFQFSHHVVSVDGKIEHRTQYINTARGKFPNFEFLRELRKALSEDNGTIFRFATHENTVLCQIYRQLEQSTEPDRNELMDWIREVTTATEDSVEKWNGKRSMVDMCDLVKRYFYHPLTCGSNSIKKVLPAVLATSQFLQNEYSKPIYGKSEGIVSKNYKDWQWIKIDADGTVMDPYKLLPPIFSDLDLDTMDSLITEGSIADGGAAMTAYARMQFTQMSEAECDRVSAALLKYCELDTFAMVLIYQYWKEAVGVLCRGKKTA